MKTFDEAIFFYEECHAARIAALKTGAELFAPIAPIIETDEWRSFIPHKEAYLHVRVEPLLSRTSITITIYDVPEIRDILPFLEELETRMGYSFTASIDTETGTSRTFVMPIDDTFTLNVVFIVPDKGSACHRELVRVETRTYEQSVYKIVCTKDTAKPTGPVVGTSGDS